MSAGVTGALRGPPAQATNKPLIPKSRYRGPARIWDSTWEEGGVKWLYHGPRKSGVAGTDLPLSDRNCYDARHAERHSARGPSNRGPSNKESDAQAGRRPPRREGAIPRAMPPAHSRLCSI